MINNFVVVIGSVSVHEISDSDTEENDSLSNPPPPIRTGSTSGTSASVSVTTGSTSGTQHNRASGI